MAGQASSAPALKALHAAQSGSCPYPDESRLRSDRKMSETRDTVEKLRQELQDVRAAAAAGKSGSSVSSAAAESLTVDVPQLHPEPLSRVGGKAARAAAGSNGPRQLSFNVAGLGIKGPDKTEFAAAVQTTRAIINAQTCA